MDIDDVNSQRRRELAQFLRKARARSKPELAGIETGMRRRTAGLRREEVATLAGASSIWYTWLEQGRDVQPSSRLLGALAVALQLTPSERDYLLCLGRSVLPRPADSRATVAPRPELVRLLSQLPVPGLLVDHLWRVVGLSESTGSLLPAGAFEHDRNNVMKIIFGSPVAREFIPDWRGLAESAVSLFHMTYARNIDDIGLNELIAELRAGHDEFAEIWDEQIVAENPKCIKTIKHWTAGMMRFEFVILRTSESREITLISLVPADGRTTDAWRQLRDRSVDHERLVLSEVACGS